MRWWLRSSPALKWSRSVVSNSMTPQTAARQAPLSMEFSRQEYWSGLPFPSPGDLPHPGIKPRAPGLQADSLPSEPLGKPYVFVILRYKESNSEIATQGRKEEIEAEPVDTVPASGQPAEAEVD